MATSTVDFSTLNKPSGTTAATKNQAGAEDRFLKLLVAQMQNQDPLNPMGTQFAQMNALQGASLVGRDVIVPGNRLVANDEALMQGGFELAGPADSVKVEVLNAGGRVIDTIEMGAQSAGRHGFEWTPPAGVDAATGERFRVVAKNGTANVAFTPLMRDRVDAVLAGGDTLTLELRNSGSVPYDQIRAFN
jgi:flagellar basal-body rod modification protein FlgD